MKKFSQIEFASWYENFKMEGYELASAVNNAYHYEVVKQTEKAVQIHVFKENSRGWTKWYPKSIIKNLDEVLA